MNYGCEYDVGVDIVLMDIITGFLSDLEYHKNKEELYQIFES